MMGFPQITINGKSTDSIHEHLIERDGLHIYIFISSKLLLRSLENCKNAWVMQIFYSCFYAQGRCRKPDITMEYFGPCLNSSTVELPDPVSSTSPPRTTTQDIIVQVFCSQATIDTCPITLDPLCGTDGKFYRNEYVSQNTTIFHIYYYWCVVF